MQLAAIARSEVGLVRANNEDSWTASPTLVAVSDGVGGRPAGEVASGLAVRVLEQLHRQGVAVAPAVESASEVVAALADANSLFTGMCCTLTAVAVEGDDLVLAHVGDSAALRVRDGVVEMLTEPQTVTARLLKAGEITPEQAAVHPKRNTMYQAIGNKKPLEVAGGVLDVRPGDRLVLSTDGLDYGDPELVAKLVVTAMEAGELADALVAAALDGGGKDNVTVVVADVVA